MEDFMVLMGESIMMEMENVTEVEYPREKPDTMIVRTTDGAYCITVSEAS